MNTYEAKIMTVRETQQKYKVICPEDVYKFWDDVIKKSDWYEDEQEHFVVLNLDSKNQVKSFKMVTKGILDASILHPREVYRIAIKEGSKSIICIHNHPSGDTTPSYEDIKITRQLVNAGKIIGIRISDNIIVGNDCFSMRVKNIVEFE